MPSPGKSGATTAADLLHEARERERAACLPEAIVCYQAAVTAAERGGEPTVLAEALRRLAVVQRHRSEAATARDLCQRSYDVARQAGNDLLAAEALNTLGGLHLSAGAPDDARRAFLEALELGGSSRELRARVEQNLGILANIQGELHEAIARYERSLDAYRDCRDEHGCALAYHNLGMSPSPGCGRRARSRARRGSPDTRRASARTARSLRAAHPECSRGCPGSAPRGRATPDSIRRARGPRETLGERRPAHRPTDAGRPGYSALPPRAGRCPPAGPPRSSSGTGRARSRPRSGGAAPPRVAAALQPGPWARRRAQPP